MAKKKDKRNWIVKMRCVVVKEVSCHNCTIREAQDDPWEYADDETEIYQEDWQVLSVEENV